MPLKPFEGPILKINRASTHLQELEAVIDDYRSRAIISYIPYPPDPQRWTLNVSEEPPYAIPIVIGDICHNLRSALDIMICDIASLRGAGLSDMEFPFKETKAVFEEYLKKAPKDCKIKKLGSDIVDMVADLRPYRDGNTLLRGLHDLNNQDKHRLVIPTVHFLGVTGNLGATVMEMIRLGRKGQGLPDAPMAGPIISIGGPPVALVPGEPIKTTGDLNPDVEFPLGSGKLFVDFPTGLPATIPFQGSEVIGKMKELCHAVSEVVKTFAIHLGHRNAVA